ncbi:sex peptide receptor-like [Haliotis rubra]|uniref:sex peptide receptor-like n=1 Tax=Haliotis rubra TaxID=36100 RepID=UPI001EE63324|nr:sex peptide receptor-like [Haliotis rubra]
MRDHYSFCVKRVASLMGGTVVDEKVSSLIQRVCLNVSNILNVTRRYSLMDLEEEAPVDLAVPLMGYAAPAVVFLTLVLNAVVVVVLTRRRLRSPTNVILVSIAVCDTFTALFSLPGYMYTYTYEGYRNYPSMGWCYVLTYLCRFTPQVLHTVSLWLTALLAFQRYVGVNQMMCRAWISRYKGVALSIVFLTIFSFTSHCFQLFLVLKPVTVIGKELFTPTGIQISNTCYRHLAVIKNVDYFSYVYTWVRLTLAQVLPCCLLLVFNLCLIRATYRSYTYRRRLVVGHKLSESSDTKNTIRISLMLLLVTCCTCIFEMFVDINLVLNFAQIYSKRFLVSPDTLGRLLLVSNSTIIFSFPFNFFFYFAFSTNFRVVILSCVKPKLKRKLTPNRVTPGVDGRSTHHFSLTHLQGIRNNNGYAGSVL